MTLNEIIDCIDDILNSDIHYDETLEYHLTTLDLYWLEEVKEIIKKQIPKKPNARHIKKYDGYNDGNCPTCGASYCDSLSDAPLFCSQCGQAFDWSESEGLYD